MNALPTFGVEANSLQTDVNSKQTLAAASQVAAATSETNAAASAAAAASSSNATIWVSGTTYAIGDVRFSPITYQSYRRKTVGAGTTDPSSDTTNWTIVTPAGMVLLAVLNPTVAAAVNMLTVFDSKYDSYMIIAELLTPVSSGGLNMRLATGGVVDVGNSISSYQSFSSPSQTNFGSISAAPINPISILSSGNYGASFSMLITNVNSVGPKVMTCNSVGQDSTSTFYPAMNMFVYAPSTGANVAAVTGFSLSWGSSQNFQAKGVIRVYGIQKT